MPDAAPHADDVADAEPEPRGSDRSEPRWLRRLAVVALAVAQAFLGLWRLATPSWHVDELVYAMSGRAYLAGDLIHNREHPPLGKYLIGLPQALLFESAGTARLLPVVAGALTGVGLFLLVRRTLGFWAGIAAWAAWVLLPRSVGLIETGTHVQMVRLERLALLDVFAATAMVAALVVGWRWARRGGWQLAGLTGVAIGLGVASKVSAASIGLVVAGAVVAHRRRWRDVAEVAMAAVTSVVVFAISYLPYGRTAPDAIRYMIDYQTQHAADGQLVYAGGSVHSKPPWWVFLAYQVEADGRALTAATVLAVIAALALVRHPVRWYLLAAVVVPLAVMTLSPVVIRHYRYIALPGQVALVGLGLWALLRRPGAWRVAGLVLAIPFAVASVRDVARIATLEVSDYQRLGQVLEAAGPEPVVVLRGTPSVAAHYAPEAQLVSDLPAEGAVAAVVLDPPAMLLTPAPELVAQAEALGYVETEMGRLRVFLAPMLAEAAGVVPSG